MTSEWRRTSTATPSPAAAFIRLAGGLLRRLFHPLFGVGGALFLAANLHVVGYSFRACTDMFFLALFAGCLFLLLAEPTTTRRWAMAGLIAGVAWLTRYNGVALVPAAAAEGAGPAFLSVATIRYLVDDDAGFQQALGEFARLGDEGPSSVEGWFEVGVAHATSGEYAAAIAPLVFCYRVDPDQPQFLENLAFSLQTVGQYERARDLYREFLVRHPESEGTRDALMSLETKLQNPDFRR